MMNSLRKITRRTVATALLAGTIGLGTIVASAPPSHAATPQQCRAARAWGDYTAYRLTQANTANEQYFWYSAWDENDTWIGANC